MTVDVAEIHALASDLNGQASSAIGKARNIVRRGAYDIREDWQKTAVQFPSPTLTRKENYDISFDMQGSDNTLAQASIGSADPLLAVIEYGSTNHAPHLLGSKALERAVPGVERALGWITDVTVKT